MKTIFVRLSFTIVLVLAFFIQLKSQDKDVKFYDVIQDDSVVMFFNTRYWLTEAYCADFKRYTRVDKNGDFFLAFTDSSAQHNIVAKGFYNGGAKNGYFELYYPNGVMRCKGNYKNNIEDGTWHFYYEDGNPERTLSCSATDILLMDFIDKDGKVMVKDGNGYFNGRVAADMPEYTVITASGKIVNGSPDGDWTSKYSNKVYCNEVFKNGKFIKGDCPGSYRSEKKNYKTVSILNSFFMPNYFAALEQFKITHCPDTTRYNGKLSTIHPKMQSYSFDIAKFQTYAIDEIKSVMDFQSRGHNLEEYSMGENTLSIAFSIDEKGTPVKFRKLTSWGDQFYEPLTRVITKYCKFPTSEEKLYFHFKLIINEGNTMSFRIYFSRDQSSL